MITYILDANVVLRFLMKDHEEMWRGAHALFQKANDHEISLELEVVIIAEIAYTLGGFYRQPRPAVADSLLTLTTSPGISIEQPDTVIDALRRFKTTSVSFPDALLAALAARKKYPVASFDTDLDKFSDVTRFEP